MSIIGIKGDHTTTEQRNTRMIRSGLTRFSHYTLPMLLALVLLMGCGPITGANAQPGATATPKATSVPSPTATAVNLAASQCPADLKSIATCYTPQVFRAAYGVDKLIQQGITGKGQTVIDIVSFGSPTLQQDMNVYDKQFDLPPVNLQIISPLNVKPYDPNGDRNGWAGETTLDVEVIHAIAPDAKIVVLVSPVAETEGTIGLPEFRQLEQYTIDHKLGNIVSQSWAASELTLEDAQGQQELQKWETLYQKATTQQGMTYLSSSGDNGATDYEDLQAKHIASVPTTGFPTDSPWVTSVGGTTLTRSGSTFSEEAWQGSGGGFSRFYKTPSYQQTLPAADQQQLKGQRGVPDIAGAADPRTGLVIYQGGGWIMVGGTSAAAPLWAGIVALANQMAGHPLGFINPALYKLAASSNYARDFRDITVGNNTNLQTNVQGYPAVQGWDPVTGLGSPLANNLVPDLVAAMK
jgi:subtilase family serine protease